MRQKLKPSTRRSSPNASVSIPVLLEPWVRQAGKILLNYFGTVVHPRQKEAPSSVVCDADFAAEAFLLAQIRAHFPDHNIITEESGRIWHSSRYTWIIDPLDGTSNFVAGLPWFGVQVAVLEDGQPRWAAMFLLVHGAFYAAERDRGAFRDGEPVRVTAEPELQRVLCAFGFDPAPERRTRRMVELMFKLSAAVRNTRATNSLVDFCYTVDGRFGACVNMKTKVWDIAPVSLLLPEAGGRLSDLRGADIEFVLDAGAADCEYAVAGASRVLHPQVIKRLSLGLST